MGNRSHRLKAFILVCVALASACDGSIEPDEPALQVTEEIGPAGGLLEIGEHLSLKIPAEALSETVAITAKVVAGPPMPPEGRSYLGDVFAITPIELQLAVPAELFLPAAPASRLDTRDYEMATRPSMTEGEWGALDFEFEEEGKIRSGVTRFGLFAQMSKSPSSGCWPQGPTVGCTGPVSCDQVSYDCGDGETFGFDDDSGCPGCVPTNLLDNVCEDESQWLEITEKLYTQSCIGYCDVDRDCRALRLSSQGGCLPRCLFGVNEARADEFHGYFESYAYHHCEDCGSSDGAGSTFANLEARCVNHQCIGYTTTQPSQP